MAITRVTAVWTGFTGAPGYTNFYFRAFGGGDLVDEELARVRAFFGELNILLPQGVTIQVQQEAAVIDETTGELLDYALGNTVPTPLVGAATSSYSAPTGAIINWNTDDIARGRRLRGRTFLVPLASVAYQADGTLSTVALQDIGNAAAELIGDGSGQDLVVWSRPRAGAGGSIGTVTSYRVPDRAAVLTSRRD